MADYKYLSRDQVIREMIECNGTFYSTKNILTRLSRNLATRSHPLLSLISSISSRRNSGAYGRAYQRLWPGEQAPLDDSETVAEPGMSLAAESEVGHWVVPAVATTVHSVTTTCYTPRKHSQGILSGLSAELNLSPLSLQSFSRMSQRNSAFWRL